MRRSLLALIAAVATAGPAVAQAPLPPRGPALLVYGNYCGLGNNGPRPPIDALDAACARHDACTPRGRLASPACNLRLQREAEAIADDPRQPSDLRGTAGMIALGASLLVAGSESVAASAPPPSPRPSYRPATAAPPVPLPPVEDPSEDDED